MSLLALQNGVLEIFDKCSTLTPINLIFHDKGFDGILLGSPLDVDETVSFPLSIENVNFYLFTTYDISWITKLICKNNLQNIDKLFISGYVASKIYYNENNWNIYKKCLMHFGEVDYFINTLSIFNLLDCQEILKTFALNNTIVNINYLRKKHESNEQGTSNESILSEYDDYEDYLLEESSRILASPSIYLNIKRLRIFIDKYDGNGDYDTFDDLECNYIYKDLSRMMYLKTLEVDYCLFSKKNFRIFCSGVNENVRNIKFYYCYLFMEDDLNVLSINCSKLKNLSLTGLNKASISIRRVLSMFHDLEGLSIAFDDIDSDFDFFEMAKEMNDLHNTLDWPEISFLEILFPLCGEIEKIIDSIERDTPRKPGMFMVRKYYEKGIFYCHIIVQRKIDNYDKFHRLFCNRSIINNSNSSTSKNFIVRPNIHYFGNDVVENS